MSESSERDLDRAGPRARSGAAQGPRGCTARCPTPADSGYVGVVEAAYFINLAFMALMVFSLGNG
jgi:hypothetical protein